MNTWIPLWSNTLQSTLWEEPPHVRVMFLTLLMMSDPDHVVREPFRRVMKLANLAEDKTESEQLARDALKVLASPDSRSVDNQEFEGRRIREVEGGWEIVNGQKYQEEMRALTARVRKTRLQRERRKSAKEAPAREKAVQKLMRPGGARTMEERLIEKAEKEGDNKTIAALDRMSPHQRQVKATADDFVAKFHKSMEAANAALAAASLAPVLEPGKESLSGDGTVAAEGAEGEKFPEV